MSHLSQIFNSVPVKIMDRSGFDMSHENLFTATVGTLIPASVEEVMPGDIISTGASLSVELPPLATNFKGRVDAKLEAFFVPNRILWAGWQDFITRSTGTLSGNSNVVGGNGVVVPGYTVSTAVPKVTVIPGAGSLADFLGVKQTNNTSTPVTVNVLPFLAYHKIWDDWYRDSNVQQPFFFDGIAQGTANFSAATLPYFRGTGTLNNSSNAGSSNSALGYNGKSAIALMQRNFAKDYFTTMTTQPQSGAAAGLEWQISVDTNGEGTTGFNIASLRAANSLQKWLERNNLGGTRYYDQILAHYGVLPPDANVNRPILLGSMTSPVIVNSIAQTANNTDGEAFQASSNPYSGKTGSFAGHGVSFGKDRLINNFEVKEHGYVFILFSLVPHAYYGTGSRRYIVGRTLSTDFAFPEFANIGDQPVYRYELSGASGQSNVVIGYNQRYSEYKYHDDEVHGLLRDGRSLESFVLQRGFDDTATLSTDLLEIPTNYMDGVMNVNQDVSGFNAIVDCYFDSKMLRVLPEYSLPSLN